jgi:ribosomal L18ae/LX-like protein
MYKEFRELTRANAVKSLYQDMAARHRARFRSIHVRTFLFILVWGLACLGVDHTIDADSSRCGDREDGGHPAAVH